MKILLAEDDEVARNRLAFLLERRGHTVVQANDGAEGLRLLEQHRFDVILFDLVMPNVNGLEMIVQARARGSLHCPAVAVTGFGRVWTEGVEGVNATIPKPVDVGELEATINRIVEARGRCCAERS